MRRPVSTWCARLAQSVEQGIENPRVRGSIPRPGTIFYLVKSSTYQQSINHWPNNILAPGTFWGQFGLTNHNNAPI